MLSLENTLIWVVTIITVWSTWSAGVVNFVDFVKPTYDGIWQFVQKFLVQLGVKATTGRHIRNAFIGLAVYAAAYMTADKGGYDVYEGAPRYVRFFEEYSLYITAIWLTAGAFLFHRAGDWLTEKRNNTS